MRKTLRLLVFGILAAISLGSCSILSESQIKSVESLADRGDSLSYAPSAIFHTLDEIRVERGLFYVASLSTVQGRIDELNSLTKAKVEDQKRAVKADAYVGVLNSYTKALKSLSSGQRSENIGRELRGIGNNVDSIIISYNILLNEDLPEGLFKLTGKAFGYLGEGITKGKQFKLLKGFMESGDSLVASCCDTLISILKGDNMNHLIDNELQGLENNFKAYVTLMDRSEEPISMDAYRLYLEQREKLLAVKEVRNAVVRGLRSFKNSHHKLVGELEKKQDIDITKDLLELTKLSFDLCLALKKL